MNSFNYIIDKHEPCKQHKDLLENILESSSSESEKQDGAPSPKAIPLPDGMDGCIVLDALSQAECDAIVELCEKKIGFTFWSNPLSGDEEREEQKKKEENDGEKEQQQRYQKDDDEKKSPPAAAVPEAAELEQPGGKFRTCSTIEVNLPALSSALWARVARFVCPTVSIRKEEEETYQRDLEGDWCADRFCYNLLFARYRVGHHFAPHIDGQNTINFNRRSMYTALFYLNDCENGGETIFYSGDQCQALEVSGATGKVTGKKEAQVFGWKPRRGSCSVFRYDVLHEGAPVAAGSVKYIIRGDVEFERRPALCDDEKGRKAFELYERARKLEGEGQMDEALKLFMMVRRISPELAGILQLD